MIKLTKYAITMEDLLKQKQEAELLAYFLKANFTEIIELYNQVPINGIKIPGEPQYFPLGDNKQIKVVFDLLNNRGDKETIEMVKYSLKRIGIELN